MLKTNQDHSRLLLELPINSTDSEKFVISMNNDEAKSMTLFSFAEIRYISAKQSFTLCRDEIRDILESLSSQLAACLQKTQIPDPSIKQYLGYHQTQDYKKDNRKDLAYKTLPDGYTLWVGRKHSLYASVIGRNRPSSWLYNDTAGNIILEISPIYPWLFDEVKPGEIFIKYSDWMKAYKPYEIIQIPRESAKEWLKQINILMQKVKRSDQKYRCTGPGCKLCAKEGKSGCPCGSSLK